MHRLPGATVSCLFSSWERTYIRNVRSLATTAAHQPAVLPAVSLQPSEPSTSKPKKDISAYRPPPRGQDKAVSGGPEDTSLVQTANPDLTSSKKTARNHPVNGNESSSRKESRASVARELNKFKSHPGALQGDEDLNKAAKQPADSEAKRVRVEEVAQKRGDSRKLPPHLTRKAVATSSPKKSKILPAVVQQGGEAVANSSPKPEERNHEHHPVNKSLSKVGSVASRARSSVPVRVTSRMSRFIAKPPGRIHMRSRSGSRSEGRPVASRPPGKATTVVSRTAWQVTLVQSAGYHQRGYQKNSGRPILVVDKSWLERNPTLLATQGASADEPPLANELSADEMPSPLDVLRQLAMSGEEVFGFSSEALFQPVEGDGQSNARETITVYDPDVLEDFRSDSDRVSAEESSGLRHISLEGVEAMPMQEQELHDAPAMDDFVSTRDHPEQPFPSTSDFPSIPGEPSVDDLRAPHDPLAALDSGVRVGTMKARLSDSVSSGRTGGFKVEDVDFRYPPDVMDSVADDHISGPTIKNTGPTVRHIRPPTLLDSPRTIQQ